MSYDQSFIPASYYEELPAQQGYNSSSPYVSDDDQFNDIHFGVYDFHDYHGKVLPGKQAIHTQREHVNPFAQVKKEYNEGYTELYFPNLAAEITSYNPYSLGTLTSESDLTTFEPVFPVEEPPMFQPITMPAPIPQAHTFPGHLRPTRVKSTIPDIPLLFSLFDVLQEDTPQNSRPQHFTPKHPHHVQQHMQQLKSVKVKKVPTREFKIFTPPVPRHVSQGLAQALRH